MIGGIAWDVAVILTDGAVLAGIALGHFSARAVL